MSKLYFLLFFVVGAAISATCFYTLDSRRAENATEWVQFARPPQMAKVSPGCLLFSPNVLPESEAEVVPSTADRVFLLNKQGTLLKTWQTQWPVSTARLDDNGELWTIEGMGVGMMPQTRLVKYDVKGQKQKEIVIPGMSHDFAFAKDRIVTTIYSVPTAAQAKQLAKYNATRVRDWRSSQLLEIDPSSGEITRRIDLYDLMKLSVLDSFQVSHKDIFHVNAVQYLPTNPWNNRDGYLITVRNISQIIFIDRESGQILWQSKKGLLSYPHSAHMLENHDILVFNNSPEKNESSVVQISIKTNEIVWKYSSAVEAGYLFSSYGGSAQRLTNGNTLVTNSMHGQVFEIASSGEIVMDLFQKMVLNPNSSPWPYAWVYRVHQYQTDQINGMQLGVKCE